MPLSQPTSPTRPILVTGAHRSGTTWVGAMLDESPSVFSIVEPFNPAQIHAGVCTARFPRWFMHLTPATAGPYRERLAKMLRLELDYVDALLAGPRAYRRALGDVVAFQRARFRHCRPLLKDPIAVFSAEWLARTFDMDVVVLIRHPGAFAWSLKRLKWQFDFHNFLDQPVLMKGDLAPFADEIRAAARTPRDIVSQAALLWRVIYSTVSRYRREHPGWLFARHEDLSRTPVEGFRSIFAHVGLDYSDAVQQQVLVSSRAENPTEAPKGVVHAIQRNSAANAAVWRSRLEPDEVERLRSLVADVADEFYTDEEWL
jgi:hypothetical protein